MHTFVKIFTPMQKDHILNVQAIKNKMKVKPTGQRLHFAFIGVPYQLTKEEIAEIKQIIKEEEKKAIEFLNNLPPRSK